MKKSLLAIACCLVLSAAAFAQSQSISLFTGGSTTQTSGTFNSTSSFSLDVYVTFSGFSSAGLSFWLQVPTALAPFITITNEQYFTFLDPNDGPTPGSMTPFNNKAFTDSTGASSAGFLTDRDVQNNPQTGTLTNGDLGATTPAQVAGTYQVATITFTLSGAPNGSFNLSTTTADGKSSELTDTSFTSRNLAAATYSISVVPEPSTAAFVLGGVGVLSAYLARRRRKA